MTMSKCFIMGVEMSLLLRIFELRSSSSAIVTMNSLYTCRYCGEFEGNVAHSQYASEGDRHGPGRCYNISNTQQQVRHCLTLIREDVRSSKILENSR